MLDRFVAAAVVAFIAGCAAGSGQAAPAAIQPTLAAITTLGFRCDAGVPDNVPSGLTQWRCPGTVNGESSTVLVDGNQEGVTGITLVSDTSPDASLARAGFASLVDAVPPVSTAPLLTDTLNGWDGAQQTTIVGGVRVSAVCDATQCIVAVVSATDPLRPLPLP